VKHWIDGGQTTLENMIPLCRRHHVLCHEGGFSVEALANGRFRFLDRLGREVLASPPMPLVTGDPAETLVGRWLPPGVALSPSTGVPTWEGEPFDYGWAIEDLQAKAGIA
jgi:hypothetical protein